MHGLGDLSLSRRAPPPPEAAGCGRDLFWEASTPALRTPVFSGSILETQDSYERLFVELGRSRGKDPGGRQGHHFTTDLA